MTAKSSTNLWIDVISLIVMIGLALTGGLIHWVLPAGSGHFQTLLGWNRHDYGQVHFWLAVAAVALLALHVLLHWTWVCCVVAKAVGRESPSRGAQQAWGLALLLFLALLIGGGLWWASTAVQETAREGRGRGGRGRGVSSRSVDPSAKEVVDYRSSRCAGRNLREAASRPQRNQG
jgi:hypothetical protein